ncbi:MAG: M42 family metallopeptidase [Chloroflexota bacterium]
MKETFARLIQELAAIDGVAGFEQQVIAYMREAFAALALETFVDGFGNLVATRPGIRNTPTLMVAAHADEIGAMVKSIDARGFLRFEKLGGTQDALLMARKVSVSGVFGVVGAKAGHLRKNGAAALTHCDMYVDVGAANPQEVAALGIRIGDPIAFVGEVRRFANPDLLCGKAIDNRVSCAMLLRLLEDLQSVDLPGTLYAVVNTQEETGWRGIQLIASRLKPDAAIVVDTIPSGDTPDTDLETELNIRIGAGPVIALLSGAGALGYITHPGMKNLLISLAEQHGIPFQPALFPGSGSDAITLHMVGEGIPTAVVNIPRRYAHSPVEMLNLNDVVNAQRLLELAVRHLTEHQVTWG